MRFANNEEMAEGAEPFYTNSTHLPVNHTDDIFEVLDHQDQLQSRYTGGTVTHVFVGEEISDIGSVRSFVRTVCQNYQLPYFTVTPTFSVCPSHGYRAGRHEKCCECGSEMEIYSRVVGYLRPVRQWNPGKTAEWDLRETYCIDSGEPSEVYAVLIAGLVPSSRVDYPGRVSAVVFTWGCNFRCPFCHNPELVTAGTGDRKWIDPERVFDLLDRRQRVLGGVVVTGGEPTLHADLPAFLERVKSFGYPVKLDSNGSRPDVLRDLIRRELVDCFAMDLKALPGDYEKAAGVSVDCDQLMESIKLIRGSGLPHEVRTTTVHPLHTAEVLVQMGRMARGADRYVLQTFVNGDLLSRTFSETARPVPSEVLRQVQCRLQSEGICCEVRDISPPAG